MASQPTSQRNIGLFGILTYQRELSQERLESPRDLRALPTNLRILIALAGKTIRNYQNYEIFSFKMLGDRIVCSVHKDNVTRENITLVVLDESISSKQLSINPRLLTFDFFSKCVVLGNYGLIGGGGSQSKNGEEHIAVPKRTSASSPSINSVDQPPVNNENINSLEAALAELEKVDDFSLVKHLKEKLQEEGYCLVSSNSAGRETWEKSGCKPIDFPSSLDILGARGVIKKIYSSKSIEHPSNPLTSSEPSLGKQKDNKALSEKVKDLTIDEIRRNEDEFLKSYKNEDAKKQVEHLEKLGDLFLMKKDYARASHLFNQALAVAQLHRLGAFYQEPLFAKLEEVERLFLQNLGIELGNSDQNNIRVYRERLQKIRSQIQTMVDRKEAPERIQKATTELLKNLLADLITNAIRKIKTPPPTSYAVITFGSMAREEMTPYSDVEFGFILEEDSNDNREYFRKLSHFLELRIINLGESFYPIIPPIMKVERRSFTPNGFSLDSAGISPLGKQGVYELIGSPQHFVSFQSSEWLQNNESEIVLVNALAQGSYLTGNQSLVDRYKRGNDELFNTETLTGKTLREERSLSLLKEHLKEFGPRLDKNRINLGAFDAKNDVYRPFQMMIGALGLYYAVQSSNTIETIQNLENLGCFSKEGANNLRKGITRAIEWRFIAQLFYGFEKEIYVFSNDEYESASDGLLHFTQETSEALVDLFQVLIPLNNAIKLFVDGKTSAILEKFYEADLIKQGNYLQSQFEKNMFQAFPLVGDSHDQDAYKLPQARDEYLRMVAMTPDNQKALGSLGLTYLRMGKYYESLTYLTKQMAILKNHAKNSLDSSGRILDKNLLKDVTVCLYALGTCKALLNAEAEAVGLYLICHAAHGYFNKESEQSFISRAEARLLHLGSGLEPGRLADFISFYQTIEKSNEESILSTFLSAFMSPFNGMQMSQRISNPIGKAWHYYNENQASGLIRLHSFLFAA